MRCRMGAISCITALRTVRRDAEPADSTKASARRPLIIIWSPSGGHHPGAELFASEDSAQDAVRGAGRDAHLWYAGRKRAQRRVQLGLHAAGGDAFGDQLTAGGSREERPNLFGAIQHAFDIGQENELPGAEGGGAGDGHVIGVDVVYLALAVACAAAFGARQLIFLTDVEGVLDGAKQVRPLLTGAASRQLIADGIATGGMQAKLNAALSALTAGVDVVRIASGARDGVLESILDGEDPGTRM